MRLLKNRYKSFVFFGVTILFLIIDRYYWAQISQWREDQAANIWLGYTHGLTNIPVGLMSSESIPNPNGMVILGYFLSHLPNLLTISLFLGIFQIILIMLVGSSSFKHHWGHFYLITIPSLSSVILRSTSIEFWNQYLLLFINLLFLLITLKYLEKPSLWFMPFIVALVCLAPSIYLAGIVNAIVIILLSIGVILYKQPDMKSLVLISTICILIIIFSVELTWLPYIRNFNIEQLLDYGNKEQGLISAIKKTWEAIFEFPVYTTFQWGNRSNFNEAFKHSDQRILSPTTNLMLKLVAWVYLLQAMSAFTAFIYAIIHGKASAPEIKLKYDQPIVQVITLSVLFIILSYIFSVWMGGPEWSRDVRPDQTVQFLPMSLMVIFLLPLLVRIEGKGGKFISATTYLSLILFCVSNLICGFMIIHDHLTYRGDALTEADVPLIQKMQVIKFVADDWKTRSSSNIIPVEYHLGGGRWEWVPEFGLSLSTWYPEAVFTEGRSFDYALKRQYGLINEYEGIQLRSFGTGRYVVTYAFEDEPQVLNGYITHYNFGRLRVSIVER